MALIRQQMLWQMTLPGDNHALCSAPSTGRKQIGPLHPERAFALPGCRLLVQPTDLWCNLPLRCKAATDWC
jgi:hypothetical protein